VAQNNSAPSPTTLKGGSLDGLTWTQHALPENNPHHEVAELIFARGLWYMVSEGSGIGLSPYYELQSADGITWTSRRIGTNLDNRTDQLHVTDLGVFTGRTFRPHGSQFDTRITSEQTTFVHQDDLYQLKYGNLEKFDGQEWLTERSVGGRFSALNQRITTGKSINGYIYLYGAHRIVKLVENDLAISDVTAPEQNYSVGDLIQAKFTLHNTGSAPLAGGIFEVEAFLSPDSFYGDLNDVGLGEKEVIVPSLMPGHSTLVTLPLEIPNLIPPGNHHLCIIFDQDGSILEKSQSNNFAITSQPPVIISGWTLSTTSTGDGSITPEANPMIFSDGSEVLLTALPNKCASLVNWTGDASGNEPQITILMDGHKAIQANFTPRPNLRVIVDGVGSVIGSDDPGLFIIGETLSLEAIPAEGWVFAGWSGDAAGNVPQLQILLDTPKTLTARFTLPFNIWKNSHFSEIELTNPAISSDDADPDSDGLPNWKEYLHASDPKNSSSLGVIQTEVKRGFFNVIYTRLSGPSDDFSVGSEGSRNMKQWDAPDFQERVLQKLDGIETIEARLPLNQLQPGFIRFNYQR
jgi:uncharacterized repeat protein (TIGR02543 family)